MTAVRTGLPGTRDRAADPRGRRLRLPAARRHRARRPPPRAARRAAGRHPVHRRPALPHPGQPLPRGRRDQDPSQPAGRDPGPGPHRTGLQPGPDRSGRRRCGTRRGRSATPTARPGSTVWSGPASAASSTASSSPRRPWTGWPGNRTTSPPPWPRSQDIASSPDPILAERGRHLHPRPAVRRTAGTGTRRNRRRRHRPPSAPTSPRSATRSGYRSRPDYPTSEQSGPPPPTPPDYCNGPDRQSPETVRPDFVDLLWAGVLLVARGPRPESGSRLAVGHPEGLALTSTRTRSRSVCGIRSFMPPAP